MSMTAMQKRALKLSKIVLVNTIPIFGYLFLDWAMFEVALTYILETFVIFTVFFINSYFINKKTRYPLLFALVQLVSVIPLFLAIMYMYTIFTFHLTVPSSDAHENIFMHLNSRLADFHLLQVICVLFIIETINFILTLKNNPNSKTSTIGYHLQKILYVYLFIIAFSFLSVLFSRNPVFILAFIVGFKLMLDYVIEDDSKLRAIQKKLLRTKWFNLHLDDTDDD